ncbi:class I SAM-dependent methyltransferase [Nostoc sp. DedQUE09]|uniref:class I SAM-dependent methyltransferase n=1 Tax=Nostoc sp. DedQUE09 TaxID=3075394 RepID=UPI002AD5A5A7|nr:class I SAM-dependent methyltransferase [Nostoc sp. DedQUE09]MDZ7949603.1 class I SAM-dependent methyltransferase [Nostoc sp. DedQUE09]
MQSILCPGCHSEKCETLEAINTSDIIKLYKRSLNIDTSTLFSSTPVIDYMHCLACDLRFFFPFVSGDEVFYEDLQQFDWYYDQTEKPEYQFTKQFVAEGASVLEVGCGNGLFRSFLPASVRYTGLEFNNKAIQKAQALGLNVKKCSIEKYAETADSSHDVVCSFQVLEHVSEPMKFLASCAKVTKHGGYVLIAVPAEDGFLSVATNRSLNIPPHHLTRWSDASLRKLAMNVDLSVEKLWHEPVHDHQRLWYKKVLARDGLNRLIFGKSRIVDNSLLVKAALALLKFPPVREIFAKRSEALSPSMQYGHTVALICRR